MTVHFWKIGPLVAAALVCAACSSPPRSAVTPVCGPDPLVEGYVLAQTIRCTWGIASQCGFAGSAYEHGLGVRRDVRRAREYYRQACDLGSQDDCAMFGMMTMKLGEKARYPEIVSMWERACEKDSVAGCHAAGLAWAFNADELGVARDVARGRAYLAKACGARFMLSCGVAARLAVQTKDAASYAEARAKLIEACSLRERESCHFLAKTELHGSFGPRADAAAAGHFWEACSLGWGAGCAGLAYLNAEGIGVPKNSDKARRLTEIACKQLHHEQACKAEPTGDYASLAPEVP
jgi:TPR repeat protein